MTDYDHNDNYDGAPEYFAREATLQRLRNGEPPSYNDIVSTATTTYIEALDEDRLPTSATVERELLGVVNAAVRAANTETDSSGGKLPRQNKLNPWQIAQLMLRFHHMVKLSFASAKDLSVIAMYQSEGSESGLYSISEDVMRRSARAYNMSMTTREFSEVMAVLQEDAPSRPPCREPDLIAVNNGILNYETKELMPFDPEIVLLAKVRIDFVHSPANPVITRADATSWDVESWVEDLFDGDPERIQLCWSVFGAVCRPNVRWNKAVLLFNESGNNGKGTIMSTCQALVGAESWAALAISDFEEKFRLPLIVGATAFGAHENDVGAFTEKMANFKAVVTYDSVLIERKNKAPFWFDPRGLMVQCLNSLPKSKDVSQSYYRRLLPWKFDKTFEGREDKAIRDDFLKRREVLQYILWKSLTDIPDHHELPIPSSSAAVLEELKENNDPVREFWSELEGELVWDLLPQAFLHDLFIAWSARTNPRGGGLRRREFWSRLLQIVAEDGRWDNAQSGRTGQLMGAPEHLIATYDLTAWKNPHHAGTDVDKICQPVLKSKYRGLLRL